MTHRLLLPLSLPLPGRGRLSGARGACTARRGRRDRAEQEEAVR
jgi:hypothetical protein